MKIYKGIYSKTTEDERITWEIISSEDGFYINEIDNEVRNTNKSIKFDDYKTAKWVVDELIYAYEGGYDNGSDDQW